MVADNNSNKKEENSKDLKTFTISEISDSVNKFGEKEFLKDLVKDYKKVFIDIEEGETLRPSLAVKRAITNITRSMKLFVSSEESDPQSQSYIVDWFFNNIGKNFTFVEYIDNNSIEIENYNEKLKSLIKSCNRKGVKFLVIDKIKGISGIAEYSKIHSYLLSNSVRFEKLSRI